MYLLVIAQILLLLDTSLIWEIAATADLSREDRTRFWSSQVISLQNARTTGLVALEMLRFSLLNIGNLLFVACISGIWRFRGTHGVSRVPYIM